MSVVVGYDERGRPITVRAGDASAPRTARHLAAMAQQNQSVRASAQAAGGLIDSCGPPYWDERSWDEFKAATGREPFSSQELPPEIETAPRWVHERLGLRPPMMAN